MASLIRKCVEESLRVEGNHKMLEHAVCFMLKMGIKLPDSETVIKIADGLFPDKNKNPELLAAQEADPRCLHHMQQITNIATCISLLAQLCLVKERM